MNITQQRSYRTGHTGTYPTDTIIGQNELYDKTGILDKTTYVGSYNKPDNTVTLLQQPDYKNPNNMIHNNIGHNVLLEQLFHNVLFIDSEYMDHSKHTNPFNFTIKFNGIEPETEYKQVVINGDTFCYTKYINGDTDVVIDRIFKNIKSVIINELFMPTFIEYITKDNTYVPKENKLNKFHTKYIVLKINELNSERFFTNNKKLGNNSFIMEYDEICGNHNSWVPVVGVITYPDSNLKLIDRLTVKICDDKGNVLIPQLDGVPYDFFKEYRTLIDNVKTRTATCAEIEKLKILKDITSYLTPELHITFCTVDPQINTLPQFRY